MLRASSLGLSLPSPTIFSVYQCRRLYGAMKKWDPARSGRSISTTPVITFLSARRRQQDAGGNPRDVATIWVSQVREKDVAVTGCLASSEVACGTATSTSTSVSRQDVANPVDAVQREVFFTLIEKELKAANIHSEVLSTPKRVTVAANTPKSKIPIKPVEISDSLHPPLTALVSEIKAGYHPQDSETNLQGTEEDLLWTECQILEDTTGPRVVNKSSEFMLDTLSEYVPKKRDMLPPRDTAAQIWKHLQILGTTPSADEAWDAYVYLVDTISEYPLVHTHIPHIPFSHLHRFCRVLSRTRPKTYRQYLRLLSVMTYTKHCGGTLQQFEFNALIDLAGKGRRKIQPEVVAKQLSVLNDLRAGHLPGAEAYEPHEQRMLAGPAFQPDLLTMTSLISTAARAGLTSTLRELTTLMNKSDLTPNRETHIAMLQYYVKKGDIVGFRATLQRMRQVDLNLGIEGLNACLMAYSKFNKLSLVFMLYRLLRHNLVPETFKGDNDIDAARARLAEEFIFVEEDIYPDIVTYTSLIQVMAYHGQFRATMEVFIDMLTRTSEPQPDPLDSDQSLPPPDSSEEDFHPTLAVYRGIFIGFCRHAETNGGDWTLENLREIFERFLTLPPDFHLTQAQLWTIMYAFAKTSDWNLREMRNVWFAIDKAFGIKLLRPQSDSALVRLRRRLFPEDDR